MFHILGFTNINILFYNFRRTILLEICHAENTASLTNRKKWIGVFNGAEKKFLWIERSRRSRWKFALLKKPRTVKVGRSFGIDPNTIDSTNEISILIDSNINTITNTETASFNGELFIILSFNGLNAFGWLTRNIGPSNIKNLCRRFRLFTERSIFFIFNFGLVLCR